MEPVFPCTRNLFSEVGEVRFEGMTIRDYFAAKAMQGMLAKVELKDFSDAEYIVNNAFWIADNMLKERSRTQGGESK